MQMFRDSLMLASRLSWRVRRFGSGQAERGQSFEAARLHEDGRRGHSADAGSGAGCSHRPDAIDADGRRTTPTSNESGKADYTLRIAPGHRGARTRPHPQHYRIQRYASPGPVLRMREGKTVSVDVINDTDVPELVHWHGMLIPSDVDGVEEEGTPPVPPRGRRRYQLTPRPAGSRWYHSHAMADADSASRQLYRPVWLRLRRLGQ